MVLLRETTISDRFQYCLALLARLSAARVVAPENGAFRFASPMLPAPIHPLPFTDLRSADTRSPALKNQPDQNCRDDAVKHTDGGAEGQ